MVIRRCDPWYQMERGERFWLSMLVSIMIFCIVMILRVNNCYLQNVLLRMCNYWSSFLSVYKISEFNRKLFIWTITSFYIILMRIFEIIWNLSNFSLSNESLTRRRFLNVKLNEKRERSCPRRRLPVKVIECFSRG